MEDTRLIHCPGASDFCDGCEVTMNEKYQMVGACGYVLTAEDKRRILDHSNALAKQE